jgi:hypothetical protein
MTTSKYSGSRLYQMQIQKAGYGQYPPGSSCEMIHSGVFDSAFLTPMDLLQKSKIPYPHPI